MVPDYNYCYCYYCQVGGGALVASTPGEHELTISLYDCRRNAAAWPQAATLYSRGCNPINSVYTVAWPQA